MMPPSRRSEPIDVSALNKSDLIVGIDFGTSYTSVGLVAGNKVRLLSDADGHKMFPSVISLPVRGGARVIGRDARAMLATDPTRTVASPKRLLGRRFDEQEVMTFLRQAPYKSGPGPDGSPVIEIWGEPYSVTQLCSYIFNHARELAEHALGVPVRRAVIAVPVTFDDARVRAATRAAQLAGLDVVAVIDEPTAAALANRYVPGFGGIIGVYDFGGGTFDFSLVDVSRSVFQVLTTAGDTWLGGDDLDQVLAEAAANQFWRLHKVDLRRQAVEWQRLLFACEQAKRELSTADMATIHVPEVLRTADGMVDLKLAIDRATLARASASLIERTLRVCDSALAKVGLAPKHLSAVYLCGGTTYMPSVQSAVSRHFGIELRTGIAPDQAVCLGAAIHASMVASGRAVVGA
ncbi:MAG: Hsp70 family protein [Kofleriaceae bacterium]|nr:Hsp70 family protein [Kofleriaceae bacterium]